MSKYTIADFNEAICKPVEDPGNNLLTMVDEQDRKIKGLVEALETIFRMAQYCPPEKDLGGVAREALEKYRSEDD